MYYSPYIPTVLASTKRLQKLQNTNKYLKSMTYNVEDFLPYYSYKSMAYQYV